MKKLLSLVLICAMGFGMISCVESVESPSVEAIRNAKAEQLKALANLYNAEAQAELIMAEAEAALLAAETAYAKAEAELKGLELQMAKESYAAQLEALLAGYEASLLAYKSQIAQYELQLQTNLDALEDAVNARINTLYSKYTSALSALNTANNNLLNKKVYLAQLEAEIIDIQTAAEKEIAMQEETIAEQEEIIANAEAQLAILTDNAYTAMNKDSLYVEYLKALVAYKDANLSYEQNEKQAAGEARKEAYNAYDDHYINIQNFLKDNGLNGKDIVTSATDANMDWPDDANPENTTTMDAVLSYYINEANLNTFKTTTFATDYAKAVETAEANLEAAKAAEAGFKGFEQAFEDAKDAQKAINDFYTSLNKYYYGENDGNWDVDNTVEVWEAKLAAVKADTVGNYNMYNHYMYHPYETLNMALAMLDELTNEKNEGYKTNAYVKALADAQAALKAVKENEDATEAEIAAAEAAVTAAQKALDKEIYDKKVYLADVKAIVAQYEGDIEETEEKLADAKEMEKEFLAANDKALAATETLNKLFGEDGTFTAFWNKEVEDENGNKTYPNQLTNAGYANNTNSIYLLADKDGNGEYDKYMDSNGNVTNGTYMQVEQVQYANVSFWYDYKGVMAMYTSNVASKTDELTKANNNLANMGEWQKNWDAKEAELRENVESWNTEIKNIQSLVDAYNEAVEVAAEAKDAVDELKNTSDALDGLVTVAAGDVTMNGLIDDLNEDIKDATEAIEDAEEAIAAAEKVLAGYVDGDGNYSEDAIAWKQYQVETYKAEIKDLEAEIEYLEVIVEKAKAALDAAVSAASAE